jgi:inositol phosphorylceramide synthase catalytic subunit
MEPKRSPARPTPASPSLAPAAPPRRRSLAERVRSTPRRYLLRVVAGFAAYLVAMHFSPSGNHPDQFLLTGAMLVLVVWSEATRRFFHGMLPFLLFGIVYDLTHITQPLVRHLHIHVDEPYRFDKFFFGIPTADGRLTPNEFFARHNWRIVDFFTGTSYIVFVYWAIGFAAYLALFRRNDERARRLLTRFGWTFLLMNIAGFVTYYVYPAAPPWYVQDYGLGPANLAARSSVAGAGRWDALMGIPYFASFYGRSADVFGAIPSLHVSYPLLTFLFGLELRKRWLDVASFSLFALVSFAAVYLNHHYVLDVLLGVLYTVVAWQIDLALERRRRARGRLAATAAQA